MSKNKILTYRRHVKNEDLNAANSLFGGRMMEWCDEAAALYAFCQMKTTSIVTVKVSELIFKKPVKLNDVLEFYATTVKKGTTSFTLKLEVIRKTMGKEIQTQEVLSCEMIFVAVDDKGLPVEWEK
jgi:acyl-CoA hydrolase